MPKRRLRVEIEDNGTTVSLTVSRRDYVGGVEIGPIPVAERNCLSFPAEDVEQWQRDMVVLALEVL
jgi:hypothetical protein